MSKYIKTNSGHVGNRRETRKDNDGFDLTFFKVIAADKHGAKVKIILGILGKQFT
jgi:hypothetical protein